MYAFVIVSFNKGIIGTVAYAVSRSSQLLEGQAIIDGEADLAGYLHGSATTVSTPMIKEITDMIHSAYSRCKPTGGSTGFSTLAFSSFDASFSDGSPMAFLLEELHDAVRGGKLAKPIVEYIDEVVRSDFENIFVGDFVDTDDDDNLQHRGTKGMHMLDMVPTDSADLALLDGTTENSIAPLGELRFGEASDKIYVKILPLLASYNSIERDFWPIQLSPMLRLIACLSDVDALLGCPILLPSAVSSGMDFEDLGKTKQWIVTASYFFSTCWIRQLINSFIHAADESGTLPGLAYAPIASFTSSSQEQDWIYIQKKVVGRLRALVELEEELRFTSSKCYAFAPPGKIHHT
jgi:hypothetical protein